MKNLSLFFMFILSLNAYAQSCDDLVVPATPGNAAPAGKWTLPPLVVNKEFGSTKSLKPGDQFFNYFENGVYLQSPPPKQLKTECWFYVQNTTDKEQTYTFEEGEEIEIQTIESPSGLNQTRFSLLVGHGKKGSFTITCSNDGPSKNKKPITYGMIKEAFGSYVTVPCEQSKGTIGSEKIEDGVSKGAARAATAKARKLAPVDSKKIK